MEKYTCLQDVLDDLYETQEIDAGEKYWKEAIKKFATKEGLLSALAYYFELWDREERDRDYLRELLSLEGQKASWCFYYLFEALSALKDPSFIPQVMRYFPPEGDNRWPWTMEDIWTEMMLQTVADSDLGPTYMHWIMRSLHLLHPGARWAAKDLMSQMLFDTFYEIKPDKFPDLSIVDALPLGKRDLVLSLLDEKISSWKNILEQDEITLKNANFEPEINRAKKDVDSAKESLACYQYVRGQLLLLPKEVISIGHR
ncbi:hypothetical protein [Holospora curviuscula]|uniref:Uncharacterized protein n=1 Tax=Holospora curviuscula TaxID=1082868 RepID=A0A2S5REG9_9PROT|nr:hypothetical protein [Holospora curviuscula]PPE05697.1 hypothetical protein HCUR_00166 [Holospora curviuscula]